MNRLQKRFLMLSLLIITSFSLSGQSIQQSEFTLSAYLDLNTGALEVVDSIKEKTVFNYNKDYTLLIKTNPLSDTTVYNIIEKTYNKEEDYYYLYALDSCGLEHTIIWDFIKNDKPRTSIVYEENKRKYIIDYIMMDN